jgi:hypothetical protein
MAWPPTRMKLGRPWERRGEHEALIPSWTVELFVLIDMPESGYRKTYRGEMESWAAEAAHVRCRS